MLSLQGLETSGRVPREQKMLKGHLPRVIYHQVYYYTKKNTFTSSCGAGETPNNTQTLSPGLKQGVRNGEQGRHRRAYRATSRIGPGLEPGLMRHILVASDPQKSAGCTRWCRSTGVRNLTFRLGLETLTGVPRT